MVKFYSFYPRSHYERDKSNFIPILAEDKPRILQYLRDGLTLDRALFLVTPKEEKEMGILDEKQTVYIDSADNVVNYSKHCFICNIILRFNYQTDGVWCWHDSTLHYVEEHNMPIDKDFYLHIKSKKLFELFFCTQMRLVLRIKTDKTQLYY